FHPNLCHVCKKTREMVNLTTCHRCFLISYCSEDHKNQHLLQHRKICTTMENYLRNNPEYLTRHFNEGEWLDAHFDFYRSIRQNLGRLLENYEEQMFVFARLCFICRQRTGLHSCKKCLSIDYCLEHKEEFEQKHEQKVCE
ncbi:hypothetical protein EAI_10206, partial [Harpegnathos saltator]